MFNDFKNLVYNQSIKKILLIKNIFDRLNISSLEERYNLLLNKFSLLEKQLFNLFDYINKKVEENPDWPVEEPPVPPEPLILPDLTITNITPTVFLNYINFEITIKNIGTANSSPCYLNEIIPDLLFSTTSIPSLDINEIFITNIQYSFNPSGTAESKTFLAEVNPDRILNESTYTNNSLSCLADIKSQYPSDLNCYIILHAHNPEGKELVPYVGSLYAVIGSQNISFPANISEHGARHIISPGIYNCSATFNGITVNLGNKEFFAGTTTELVFIFPRTNVNLSWNYNDNKTFLLYPTHVGGGYYQESYAADIFSAYSRRHLGDYGQGFISYNFSSSSFSLIAHSVSTGYPPYVLTTYIYTTGGVYSYSTIPINILPQSFTNWYSQYIKSGVYPQLFISTNNISFSPKYDLCNSFSINSFPANLNYKYVLVDFIDEVAIANNSNKNVLNEKSGTLESGLKISSVPYDLDEISF